TGWARGLKAAGYATNPQYPQIIIKLVEDYNLSRFDKGDAAAKDNITAEIPKKKKDKKTEEVVALIQQSIVAQAANTVAEDGQRNKAAAGSQRDTAI
ncbi:hypothetical protein ACSTJU_23420, partial [Vibrio parahaemolyticus]